MTVPVRILADGSIISAGPKMGRDYFDVPAFTQSPEATEKLTLDWSGYLGAETISSSVWVATRLTLTSQTVSGDTTNAFVSAFPRGSWGEAKNTVTTSGGRVHPVKIRFYPPDDENNGLYQ
jgi:hypothetical protein